MNADAAAILAAAGFAILVLFQLAIAAGAPFGPASWGGTHEGALPPNLRAGSAVAALVWTVASLVVLGRVDVGPLSGSWLRWAVWGLVGLLVVGAVMNAASRSRWERFGWAPFSLVLALLCLAVALD